MRQSKVITAVILGNALEWYDYVLYATFASVISKVFFADQAQNFSLLATFAIFSVGFISRPIGAFIFGYIGDEYGRKTALFSSIIMMAIPATIIGLIPSYQTIGSVAPVGLLLCRMLQGISVGGEFSASSVYLLEISNKKHRGLYSSIIIVSLALGSLLGSLAGFVTESIFTEEEILNFWWRAPFLLSFVIGAFGLYMRKNLSESEEFLKIHKHGARKDRSKASPIKQIYQNYKTQFLICCLVYLSITISFYTLSVFSKTLLVEFLGYNIKFASMLGILSMVCMMFGSLCSGVLSLKISPRTTMIVCILISIALIYPAFVLYDSRIPECAIIASMMSGLIIGISSAQFAAIFFELFPAQVRSTGMSFASNIPAMLFGGTTPMILVYIVMRTDNIYYIALYCGVTFVISILAILSSMFCFGKRLRYQS